MRYKYIDFYENDLSLIENVMIFDIKQQPLQDSITLKKFPDITASLINKKYRMSSICSDEWPGGTSNPWVVVIPESSQYFNLFVLEQYLNNRFEGYRIQVSNNIKKQLQQEW